MEIRRLARGNLHLESVWIHTAQMATEIFARVCKLSDIIRLVEHLLNLLWAVVVSVLAVLAVRGHSRGTLRCSLAVALGCTVLIALVLFPALSMTDDLQRAKLDTETSSRHLGDTLLLGANPEALGTVVEFLPVLMLLLLAARLVSAGRLSRLTESLYIPDRFRLRPEAARPPPALAFA